MQRVAAMFSSAMLISGLIFLTITGIALNVAMAEDGPPGAMSCTGCHGPQSDPSLSLKDHTAPDIIKAMTDFRSGERPATIMDRIARGFSETETKAIAEWLEESEQ